MSKPWKAMNLGVHMSPNSIPMRRDSRDNDNKGTHLLVCRLSGGWVADPFDSMENLDGSLIPSKNMDCSNQQQPTDAQPITSITHITHITTVHSARLRPYAPADAKKTSRTPPATDGEFIRDVESIQAARCHRAQRHRLEELFPGAGEGGHEISVPLDDW